MKSDTATTGPGAALELVGDVGPARLLARVQEVPRVDLEAVATQLVPRGDRPDVGLDAPVVARAAPGRARAHGTETPDASSWARGPSASVGAGFHRWRPRTMPSTSTLGRLRRLDVRLVVDRSGSRRRSPGPSPYIRRRPSRTMCADLEAERRVVGDDGGVRRGEQRRVPVLVLEALAVERRTAGGGAEHEAARHLVGGGPEARHRCAGTRTSSRRCRPGSSARRAWRTTCRPR